MAALQDAVRPPPAPPLEVSAPPPRPAEVDRSPAPPPAPARTVGPLRLALLALVVAVLLAGSWWLGRTTAGEGDRFGRSRTELLAEGQVRSSATRGQAQVAITGPTTVQVGERATYTASTSGVQHSRWLAPDGRSYEDEPTLFIVPTSDGTTTVRLLGQASTGEVVMAELRVTVRPRT